MALIYSLSNLIVLHNFQLTCSFASNFVCFFVQEQLESAQREIAVRNERERQLQGKLLKAKEDLKSEREEVSNPYTVHAKHFLHDMIFKSACDNDFPSY